MANIPYRLLLAVIFLLCLAKKSIAQQPAQTFLWQIGQPDNADGEFALAPAAYNQFAKDGIFIVGRSTPKKDWPYVQPGPDDAWAGSKPHSFAILFGLENTVPDDSCTLAFQIADVGHRHVDLDISINQHSYPARLPQGEGEAIYGDLQKGHKYAFTIKFPSDILLKGDNSITITSTAGSWFLYDWLGLKTVKKLRIAPLRKTITLTGLSSLPFLSMKDHAARQSVNLSVLNAGDPGVITVGAKGLPPQKMSVATGRQQLELFLPAVTKDSSLELTVQKGPTVIAREKILLQPVRKMTVYILPHSHNDIGYTELQSKVETKQLNNLLKGIEYAKRTKDYPAGAHFVWNLEGSAVADLFLQRMDSSQIADFYSAVADGSVALNGMYFNTLTGLCRPEELLQLFRFSTRLAQQAHVKLDAAMISDVPGYTWGTVTAMAQAGIKYFSAAPNYFDRIGDILQKWEDKPFYWVSPSGAEKVLVWIPYKGYALSHGLPGLSSGFVTDYIHQLDRIHYPYDITYIRWSGHGDNAEPEIAVSDFVRDWDEKYTWPKFIISSTSTAFSAFEKKYGDQLPLEKGDWTGYWEDGAGSSAVETSENRASSSRLTQAEALWAMLQPGNSPTRLFHDAWRQVLRYSEHTWGAYCSVTDPLSEKTVEQWNVKRSYADTASRLSEKLLAGALATPATPASSVTTNVSPASPAATNIIDVFNTNSWSKTGLVQVSPALSNSGDIVKDGKGATVPSQRLSTGELAFVAQQVPPFSASRYTILPGKAPGDRKLPNTTHVLDNGIIRVSLDPVTGAITSLRNHSIENNFADSSSGKYLNDYLFLPGKNLADLRRNGPVIFSIKEKGPVLTTLSVVSQAPGCNKLTREIRLVNGFDYVDLTNILDKKPAELNPHPGDYAWANTGGKESVHFGFPFQVPQGEIKLDIPMALMRPETDQIPGSCKNWLEAGGWADVSNSRLGITWATLDAPLVELGGITATLLGGQTDPDVWRKHIGPTQELYSWALNNHWETNYRASQEGIITFRYALRPHTTFDPLAATQFSTGLSQPLIVSRAGPEKPTGPLLRLSTEKIIVLRLKPSDDGKALIVTLFNPTTGSATTGLQWSTPVKRTFYSNTGELSLDPAPDQLTIKAQDLVTLRVEK